LNLTNLARGAKDTVEFRVFSGTTNATKVVGWIQVCLGLVERALAGKRMPTWSSKPLSGGWKKAGEGQSEAERLMGYLAWDKGYAERRAVSEGATGERNTATTCHILQRIATACRPLQWKGGKNLK
jgi:hypothetical protein